MFHCSVSKPFGFIYTTPVFGCSNFLLNAGTGGSPNRYSGGLVAGSNLKPLWVLTNLCKTPL